MSLKNIKFGSKLATLYYSEKTKNNHVEIIVDEKLDMSPQCAFTAQKVNGIVGCVKRRVREVTVPLCSGETTPVMLHPQHKKYMDLLEQVQRMPQRCSEGWSTSVVETD